MVYNPKTSNDTTITVGDFKGIGNIYLGAPTPWECPSVPTVEVFKRSKNS